MTRSSLDRSPERFTVKLAAAACVSELEAWIAAAAAGDQAQYASGIDLPRAEAGVVLVTRWKDAGLVTTVQRRDPLDERRWQFLVARTSAPLSPRSAAIPARSRPSAVSPATPIRGRASHSYSCGRTASEAGALLDLLRGRAAAGKPCPGLVETVQLLGLASGRRGKNRAQYLFRRLEGEGRIAVRSLGANRGRVVTIRAKGRACGKSTGEPQ